MRLPSVPTVLCTSLWLNAPVQVAAAPSAKRVQQLFKCLATGNFDGFYSLFSPDATWNTIGFGVRTFDEVVAVFDEINCLLSNPPLAIVIDLVISQGLAGQYTSVQAHVPNGYIGTNGVQYNQTYSWIIEWKGETIVANTEYINDFLAQDLIGDNAGNC